MVAAYRDSISARAGTDPIAVDPSTLTYSANDVLVLHLWAITSIATPSGSDLTWTQRVSDTIVGPFSNTYCHKVFTAVADASITSFTVDVGAADSQAFILTSVSGADTGSPVDGTPTFASEVQATDATPQSPSITDLSGSDSLLIGAVSVHRNGPDTRSMTSVVDLTEREDFPSDSQYEQFAMGTLGLSSNAATGDKTWTPSGTLAGGEAWMSSSIAIKSAGGGGTPHTATVDDNAGSTDNISAVATAPITWSYGVRMGT
jgi:hypothetical protein